MSFELPGPPLRSAIVEDGTRPGAVKWSMTKQFADWLLALVQRAQTVAVAVASLGLTAQSASLGLTAVVPVASGVYRVSWHVRVTTAASTSSSIQVSVVSTEGGVACTQSGPAYAGNATNAPQSGTVLVHADPNTPISVSTTYASVGTPMLYALDVVVEQLS